MDTNVFLAVLAAAAMHAGWNAFLKLKLEPFIAMTMLAAAAGLVALPVLAVAGWPGSASWPWLAGSVFLHLAYYVVLSAAYARADMSQVYPIARGGAPLLTATASLLLLHEPISDLQLAGVAALGCGVAAMSILGRRRGTPFDPVAIALAVLTAFVICGYTLADGLGARAAGNPHAYSAALFVVDAVPLVLFALWWRGPAALASARPFWRQGAAAGAMSVASYWIAIWAMTKAPIPLVAALRESSVLFAIVIAIVVVREPLQWPRAFAAVVILAAWLLSGSANRRERCRAQVRRFRPFDEGHLNLSVLTWPGSGTSIMDEHRVAARTRTFLPARIEIAEIGVAVNCTVRDLSETGARLEVASASTLPPVFKVYIPKFDRYLRAEQRWRRGGYVGIHFEAVSPGVNGPAELDGTPDHRYVKKLEDELSRLRRLLETIRADPSKARLLLDSAA